MNIFQGCRVEPAAQTASRRLDTTPHRLRRFMAREGVKIILSWMVILGLRPWVALLAMLLLAAPALPAAPPAQEERWLLVVDTSWPMKKRLPAVETALKTFLGTSGEGQLHAGDSVGVWTFSRQLRTGEFPLLAWKPELSAMTVSNLVRFIKRREFGSETHWDVLAPKLDKLVASSERLTVLIFCDGGGKFVGTPYDGGISQTFQQNSTEREKSRQPFILVLRSQQGKYIGCTVNFPPGELNLPPFPAWPEPPKPVVTVTMVPPPAVPPPPAKAPIVTAAPLIIVGTHVGTNAEELKKIASPAPVAPVVPVPPVSPVPSATPVPSPAASAIASNPPAAAPPAMKTEAAPAKAEAIVTSAPPAKVEPPPAPTPTPKPAPVAPVPATATAPEAPAPSQWLILSAGAVLLALAAGLWWGMRLSRRPRNSLITDSLNVPKPPPPEK